MSSLVTSDVRGTTIKKEKSDFGVVAFVYGDVALEACKIYEDTYVFSNICLTKLLLSSVTQKMKMASKILETLQNILTLLSFK